MQLKQKKFGTQIEFNFKDDRLDYKLKSSSGLTSFNVLYENISNDITESETKNEWYRNVGFAWVLIGLIDTFILTSDGVHLSFWLVLGLIFYGIYVISAISYSCIDASNCNLLIIKNKKHDEVITKLFQKRNDYLKSKYAKIDVHNRPENELNKFKWLKEIGAITEQDFNYFEGVITTHLPNLRRLENKRSEAN